MALLNCKECGKEISSAAPACPYCGASASAGKPTKAAALKTIIAVGVVFSAVLYFHFRGPNATEEDQAASSEVSTASMPPSPAQTPTAEQPKNLPVKPGDFVKLRKPLPGCVELEDLRGITVAVTRHEKAKAMEYFSPDGGRRCITLNATTTYKVISVQYNSAAMPDFGIMNITNTAPDANVAVWTFTDGAVVQ